jgi:hypothetical protein
MDNLFSACLSPLLYSWIHITLSNCVVHFSNPVFITDWCAIWGLKLDSKDVQGRVGMKIEVDMVQSFPMETPNISFSNVWNTLLNTFCCLHVYVNSFPFICVFCFKIFDLQQWIFHCFLLVLNLNAHESI